MSDVARILAVAAVIFGGLALLALCTMAEKAASEAKAAKAASEAEAAVAETTSDKQRLVADHEIDMHMPEAHATAAADLQQEEALAAGEETISKSAPPTRSFHASGDRASPASRVSRASRGADSTPAPSRLPRPAAEAANRRVGDFGSFQWVGFGQEEQGSDHPAATDGRATATAYESDGLLTKLQGMFTLRTDAQTAPPAAEEV